MFSRFFTTGVALLAMGGASFAEGPDAIVAPSVRETESKMQGQLDRKADEARAESTARSQKSSAYIRDEEAQAKSAKDGRYEILMNTDRTGFKMDVPELTVGDEETRIPTIHTKMDTTSFNVPVPAQCKVGSWKIPEFRDLRITFKEQDILAPCLSTKQVKMDLPQFTAGETTIRLPTFKVEMKTREFSLNLPQFTERTPDHEMRKHEEHIAEEKSRLQQDLSSMEDKYRKAALEELTATWQQGRDNATRELDSAERSATEKLKTARADLETKSAAAMSALRGAGATAETIDGFSRQIDLARQAMDRAEANTHDLFESKKKELNASFDEMKQRYLGQQQSAM
ncbi:hypothetical protein XH98_28505 [Bradyrhizobium sp. CCBAU 51745]|nr:hypothetical protein [Bradyrhizobium sp. CCBAU 51745]